MEFGKQKLIFNGASVVLTFVTVFLDTEAELAFIQNHSPKCKAQINPESVLYAHSEKLSYFLILTSSSTVKKCLKIKFRNWIKPYVFHGNNDCMGISTNSFLMNSWTRIAVYKKKGKNHTSMGIKICFDNCYM